MIHFAQFSNILQLLTSPFSISNLVAVATDNGQRATGNEQSTSCTKIITDKALNIKLHTYLFLPKEKRCNGRHMDPQ